MEMQKSNNILSGIEYVRLVFENRSLVIAEAVWTIVRKGTQWT